MDGMSEAELEALVEEATVDCYDEHEEVTGLFSKIQDNLAVPFETQVLGVDVTVKDLDLRNDGCIVAICARGRIRQAIPVLDLPLPDPPPDGAEWIDAYGHWAG
jgi:hypothetical protein